MSVRNRGNIHTNHSSPVVVTWIDDGGSAGALRSRCCCRCYFGERTVSLALCRSDSWTGWRWWARSPPPGSPLGCAAVAIALVMAAIVHRRMRTPKSMAYIWLRGWWWSFLLWCRALSADAGRQWCIINAAPRRYRDDRTLHFYALVDGGGCFV